MDTTINKHRLFWILQIIGWSIFWLLLNAGYFLGYNIPSRLLIWRLLTVFIGFIISTVIRYLYLKIDFRSFSIFSLLLIITGVTYIAANFWYGIDLLLNPLLITPDLPAMPNTLSNYLVTMFSWWVLLFTWSIIYFAIKIWMVWNLQKERAIKATVLAQKAQLQMLRHQLNPHFLFNSLNSIRALIEENEKNAKAMITELSEFLRYSLISKDFSDVPLSSELEVIRHYFAIEKKRYEDKLDITIEIDPLAEDYPVISFLIHPLVENAVKYGMQTSTMPLKIRMKAIVLNGALNVEIHNTGKWVKPAIEKGGNENGTGTGLDNVRERLENAFPSNHHLEIAEKKDGMHVKLQIYKKITKRGD